MRKLKKNLQKGAGKSGYENWKLEKTMSLASEATMLEHIRNLSSNDLMEAYFKAYVYYNEQFFFEDWMRSIVEKTLNASRVCSKRKLL